jgi:hypothetical protein
MTKGICKAVLKDGSRCTNFVDKGQTLCPYHISLQTSKFKTVFKWLGTGATAVGMLAIGLIGASKNRRG